MEDGEHRGQPYTETKAIRRLWYDWLPPRFFENPFVWGEVGARNQDVVKARHLQDLWGLRGQGVRQHESVCKGIYMVEAHHNKAVLPLAARTV